MHPIKLEDSMNQEASVVPSPPGSPTGTQVHQRRGMPRSGGRGSDVSEDNLQVADAYDLVEKDGASATANKTVHYPGMEKSTLQVGTVALLVFFTVSGGPLGSEDAVSLSVGSQKDPR